MKKVLLLICTILCANVLLAQTEFMVGELLYQVTNPNEVEVKDCVPVATSIIIPTTVSNSGITYNVTSIGEDAFYGCSSLTSVNIGNGVTSIGHEAFKDCSSLTSVTIPNSVTSIGGGVFYNCSSLTSVNIPNSVTSIGGAVFYNCSSLTSVTLSNNITELPCVVVGWNYYGFFENCSSLTSITIPNSVTSIGDRAFNSCSSLTSVTIGNSVTSIGDRAFKNCSSLTSVDIPNSVTSIGYNAFQDCTSLNTLNFNARNCTPFSSDDDYLPFIGCSISVINIGENVQRIPDYFAYDCDNLTSIDIPNSVTSIGPEAFGDCDSLTSVTIGNSVTSIGDRAFKNCSSLTSVNIGNSVTSIGPEAFGDCSITTLNFNARNCNDFIYRDYAPYYDYPPFYYCTINTINIGNSVERIPAWFAEGISSLTSVTIGNSVTSIGDRAFKNCSSLDTVTCLATTPPTIDDSFFNTPSNKKLIVYCGFKNYYAMVWGDDFAYDNIYEIPFAIDVNVNNEVGGNVTIENNCSTATLTATANDCYQFVSWNDGNTDNPRIISFTSDTSLTAIFEDLNTELSATICEGSVYNENGFNVSEAGVYTQNLTSVNGCDSIVTLTLNVNPIFNTELSATICEGQVYTENNFNVSEAGVYTQTLQTVNGCDSIVTLTLNVNSIFNTELTATICEGQAYTENNFNVSEAGVYTQTLTAVNGCDSIVTLTLNVNPIYNTELSATICEGQVYTENNFNVSEAGVYTQTLQTVNGCDSIVTLTLNVNPHHNTELTATICPGERFIGNGFNVTAGVYTQSLHTIYGCDSIVTLTVTEYPIFDTTINATINPGETYAEFGFNESEAGTYVQNLQTVNGCDSTITLVLSVNSSLLDIEETEISLYPNPTKSEITFSQAIEKVEVIDLTGKAILTFTNAKTINIESLPSGAYYLRLTNDEKTIMRKVIKQ